jgi:uncharacterized protein (TIGR02466 family)
MEGSISIIPNLVYKFHYTGDLGPATTRAISDTCIHPSNVGSMRGGGKTTANHTNQPPHTWEELKDLFVWLEPKMYDVWKSWDMADLPLHTENSWTNIQAKGGYCLEHDHSPSHMSLAIYLQKPENTGNIEFRNPLQTSWSHMPRRFVDGDMHDFFHSVDATTGDVVIFPGWLSHRVQLNQTDEIRVVMSMNVNGVKTLTAR